MVAFVNTICSKLENDYPGAWFCMTENPAPEGCPATARAIVVSSTPGATSLVDVSRRRLGISRTTAVPSTGLLFGIHALVHVHVVLVAPGPVVLCGLVVVLCLVSENMNCIYYYATGLRFIKRSPVAANGTPP